MTRFVDRLNAYAAGLSAAAVGIVGFLERTSMAWGATEAPPGPPR